VAGERQQLIRAAQRSKAADAKAQEARYALWVAMAEARRARLTLQEIADIAGLSRRRVMDILQK
jgi:hypothetical protein